MKELCVIGCGVMGGAMLKGIVNSGLIAPQDIIVTGRTPEKLERLRGEFKVEATEDNREAVSESKIILVALKPQILVCAAKEFSGVIPEDALVISIAAGKTIQRLEGYFPGRKIIRGMPNLPALVSAGMSLICGNERVTPEDRELALRLFRTFGEAEEIPERLMDAAMSVASCSPAYAALFVEALSDAGVKLGLTRKQSLAMAGQAIYGAMKLILEEGMHPAILKDRVCSPGGTTIEGVSVLESLGFRGTVIQAVESALRRAKEL